MATYIGNRRELFADKALLEKMEGTALKLHEPVPMETSIVIDRPWEGVANGGISVLKLDGRYLMFYRAMNPNKLGENGRMCLAVSDDGIHWEKPELQAEGTNFVDSGNFFLDTRPGIPKEERIKGFFTEALSGEAHTPNWDPVGGKRCVFYASADGTSFRKMSVQPVLESHLFNCFDGGCSMFWSDAEQQYVFYYRYSVYCVNDSKPNDISWRRSVARVTSKDFYTWSEPEEMAYSDIPEQFYVNNTQPYFRAPHLYVGIAARFMEGKRVLTDEQVEACGILPVDAVDGNGNIVHYTYYNDCSDAVLLTTRAGSSVYDRTFMETFVRPGPGFGNWGSRCNYPLDGGFFQMDDTTMSFFVSRRYMQDSWHIQRMSLRLDGFASLHAPWKGGEAITKPIIYDGSQLELNYRTSAAGWIRVEITDENGIALPGFGRESCEIICGDQISRTVAWRSESSLSRYAGKPIRLRFVMKDADIYSYKFNRERSV